MSVIKEARSVHFLGPDGFLVADIESVDPRSKLVTFKDGRTIRDLGLLVADGTRGNPWLGGSLDSFLDFYSLEGAESCGTVRVWCPTLPTCRLSVQLLRWSLSS